MAVATEWTITHSCGHEQDHDLSAKKPADRAGLAHWLEKRECTDCWRASRGESQDKEEWLAQRRAEESALIAQWEARAEMPRLDGSDKAVEWGRRVRYTLMSAAYDLAIDAGQSEDSFIGAIETPARKVTSASWWIDQRDMDPADVEELVQSATEDPAVDTGCENIE